VENIATRPSRHNARHGLHAGSARAGLVGAGARENRLSLGRRRKKFDRDRNTGGIVTVVFKEISDHCRYFF